MLDKFRDLHQGEDFAVIGSAPSALLFKRNETKAIGVNGAGKLLQSDDYFISGDEATHTRSWFKGLDSDVHCILRPHTAIYSEKFYPNKKLREDMIRVYETYMDKNPNITHFKKGQGLRCILPGNEFIDYYFSKIPEPAKNHYLIRKVTSDEPVSKYQTSINVGGTSACMAVQVAFIMGAKNIHLYGVEFSNEITSGEEYKGSNYFYKPEENETGMTLPSQRVFLDDIIKQVINKGVPVYSHGPTKLKETIKLL
ncbi:MAG: hypothetical protein ABIC91_03285 [Nanoarchaeota archaeon]|nr:hypothetical protein [Nanoarchaeota archaeon]MBU1030053.1 hypothetical protein [Nanoarchaeota archaeon]MBU1850462.1 hypothetical protein [Nanoarchaeota archaeon]